MTWEKKRPKPKWFHRGDAQRFVRGSMEILVVKRFDSIAVQPHATLVVSNCQPIRFRKQAAAMRAADEIEAIKRKGAPTYQDAVRLWQKRRALKHKAARERYVPNDKPSGRPPKSRPPSSTYSQRPRSRALREKTAALVVRRGMGTVLDKAAVHPSLWPENAGTW